MIFMEKKNCWCVTTAEKVSFLVDGADYFEAFARAAMQARQTIYIAGWDIDSRLILDRRGALEESIPPLGEFLNQCARNNERLRIYVLAWDFPMMYLREREWLPKIHLGWKTHRRVHLHLDSEHPMGASLHEKVVVIDDRMAFCGGIDLTKNRWDTSEHPAADHRRIDSDGKPYAPFHDVQTAVSGETARSLGMRFRERWQRATGRVLSRPRGITGDPWPVSLPNAVSSPARIAIARTLPAYKNQEEVRETLQLYADAIRSARRFIYIESQYLTVDRICRDLGVRLADSRGPEVIIIMPKDASGWLEQSTMDAIRKHRLQWLRSQDHHQRLAVYYPVTGEDRTPVYVHSKLMVVDDRMAVVGSANLTNRSMGLDVECGLALTGEAGSAAGSAVSRLRRGLLAEHLGVTLETLAQAETQAGSLRGAIESIGASVRGLVPLDGDSISAMDGAAWIGDTSYLDPEEPFMLDRLLDQFAHNPSSGRHWSPLIKIGIIIFSLLTMTALWRWTPLSRWITSEQLAHWAGLVDSVPLMIPAVIAGFILGGLLFVPVTLMIGATALILPPWQSFSCAMAGILLNAAITYWIGRRVGLDVVRKLAGPRIERLNHHLARKGIVATALVRNLPIAPFTVVNIVAGTSGIRLSHYLIGTAIGMLPGIVIITLFTGRILALIRSPGVANTAMVVVILILMGLGLWWLRRRLRRREVARNE